MEQNQNPTQQALLIIHQTVSTILGLSQGRKNDLSPIATAILYNAHTKQLQVTDISKTFQIKKSTASGYVDTLEKKGYAKRVKDQSNRRNTYVVPTEKGEKYLSEKEKMLTQYIKQHTANLTQEEQTVFLRLLEKFMKPIE
jgi:DNA-binding MarR family transcriptional regulator